MTVRKLIPLLTWPAWFTVAFGLLVIAGPGLESSNPGSVVWLNLGGGIVLLGFGLLCTAAVGRQT